MAEEEEEAEEEGNRRHASGLPHCGGKVRREREREERRGDRGEEDGKYQAKDLFSSPLVM